MKLMKHLGVARRTLVLQSILSIGCALLGSMPTYATFIVLRGNNPEPDEENIQFTPDAVGMTVQGTTNQTNSVVQFTSPTQFLANPASGQARIEARQSNNILSPQVAIDDSIIVSLPNPALSFGDLIFNASIGQGVGDGGTLTVVVNGFESNGDPVSTTFTTDENGNPLNLGNGSNFYTVLASDGQRITSVDISPNANSSYGDLRQIRISQIIPEPASALLFVIGSLVIATRRRLV